MDIEFRSSCASKALHEFMLQKDYEAAKEVLKDDAYYEGTFDEAWAEVLGQYSASKMELEPVTADQVRASSFRDDMGDRRKYLARIGSVVFVSTAHRFRDDEVSFYNPDGGGWIPVGNADEIMEIQLT